MGRDRTLEMDATSFFWILLGHWRDFISAGDFAVDSDGMHTIFTIGNKWQYL